MEIYSGQFSNPNDEDDPIKRHPFSRIQYYSAIQSFLLIPALWFPIVFQTSLSIENQIISFAFSVFSLRLLWMMFQRNRLFFRLESFRLVSVFLLSAYLLGSGSFQRFGMFTLSALAFISLIWLFILKPEFEN